MSRSRSDAHDLIRHPGSVLSTVGSLSELSEQTIRRRSY